MKKYFLIIIIFFVSSLQHKLDAQELKCSVQVLTQKVQGTNKQVFETLQNAMFEFMNNRVWTNHVFGADERIECNFVFNITEQISADEFKGDLQIQVRRPVYNSSYNSVALNFKDNDIHFQYVEYQPLEFNPTTHLSNLTSILAFYAYVVIGLDYDTFGLEGGTPFFEMAQQIVNNAQNAPQRGWKAFESTSRRNRYWLVNSLMDEDYKNVRRFFYTYHRRGLDLMDSKVDQGRSEIAESLKLLQDVYRNKPDPFLFPLQIVFDAKSDEFVNVFSEGQTAEKNRVHAILTEIDPANSSKYEKITEN
jgi:hypothetical protein